MLKRNNEYVFPLIPLIVYAVLSFSNGIAQIAVDDHISTYEQSILKILEYGIGISVMVSVIWAVISSVGSRCLAHILGALIIILFINLLMPVFVKFTFAVIVAIALVGAICTFVAPVTSAFMAVIGYLTGTLGTVLLGVAVAAMTIASYIVGQW